ncbi:uncharacterized protein TNCT_331661 [Trichonephila clavata]|uniref:Gustatory receptor n=1 Tax=Trichonephila clavata TaxID=2740835 RepID=A0A8X6JEE9_TRICU|nr:uncharacterized protein TNCT_331661 [Trichonephila clavata]
MKTLIKLGIFGLPNLRHKKRKKFPLRNYAILACGLCVFIPGSIAMTSTVMILHNVEKYKFTLGLTGQNSTSFNLVSIFVFIGHQIMFMVHFFMFPGLVMTLLSFAYLSYVKTFQRHLEAMRFGLLNHFSKEEISKALMLLTVAQKIRSDVEKSMSFIAFIAYVLTFGNILFLVCGYASDYLADEKSVREVYFISIFSWTLGWFVVLTTCGSRGVETETFIKDMTQEVISKNFYMKCEGHKRLIYMNLLNSCSGCEVKFTGWGMFEVNKKLFLTVLGVLVTYGVLFASELRKTSI